MLLCLSLSGCFPAALKHSQFEFIAACNNIVWAPGMETCGTSLAIDTPPVSIQGAYMTLLYAIRNSNGLNLLTSNFTLPWNYLNDLNFSSPFNLESGNGKKTINNLLQGAHWYETAPIDSKRTLVGWWNGSQLSTERGDLLNFGYWVLRFDV